MMEREFRHYRVLREQLQRQVDDATVEALLSGMGGVRDGSPPAIKVAWAAEMMRRLDATLDEETRICVREGCACVLSGEKSVYAQQFRRLRTQHRRGLSGWHAPPAPLRRGDPMWRCHPFGHRARGLRLLGGAPGSRGAHLGHVVSLLQGEPA